MADILARDTMINNEAIKLAIEDLESQETPNYSVTVKKYSVS
ncbi:hypothetical protein CIRG_06378 [Coccidioides immitis RMSCC 2394]|uniref:Uncharacterized protein n=1 Tax=Coccidioides immitis RMSCC 2394 TaxID=404692 RepID=A0A0J7B9K1_COCIT|nr:hypothetical protein CIRG_06378 [Coccidioides immitis RMSCC 2394]